MTGGYYVIYDGTYIDDSPPGNSGSTKYYDGRLTSLPDLETVSKFVFNGAVGYSDWINWDWNTYDPTAHQRGFLTTLPDNWTMKLDNDAYLNIWGNRRLRGTELAILTTFDSAGSIIDTFNIDNENTYLDQTEIQNLSVGPRGLNLYHPDIIQNGTFQTLSNWTLIDATGGVAVISGGTLNYSDAVGDGESIAWQYSALTIGCGYEVTITASNNTGVGVQVGDGNDVVQIVPYGSGGTYTASFTAVQEDFTITMTSGIAGQNDIALDTLSVRQLCPIINCDVASYNILIQSGTTSSVEESVTLTFPIDCTCTKYTNYPLLFKDRLGSYVPFNFELNNTQKVTVKNRDTYKKFIGTGGAASDTYSANERSPSIFNVDINEEWTLNTNWLTEVEAAYFEELVTSPEVSILIDGTYRAVMITDRKYNRVRKNNKKNIQYNIKIEFANNNTINV